MKIVALALVVVLAGISLQKTMSLNFSHFEDDNEPYAHVQTFDEIMIVMDKINRWADQDPTRRHLPIHVVVKSYWPISWLLRDFTKDTYFTDGFPPKADAAILFCDANRQKELELKLRNTYFIESFRLNPAQDLGPVYFDRGLFKDFFPKDAPIFTPAVIEEPRPGEGLVAKYYGNESWTDNPTKEDFVGTVNFSWDTDERPMPSPFGIVFEGEIHIEGKEEVTFFLASDDGSSLEIGGNLLINNLGAHPERVKSVSGAFDPGWHPIRIHFYDIGGAAAVRLSWKKTPSATQEIVPAKYLRFSVKHE